MVRREITAEWETEFLYSASVQFLLSPRFTSNQSAKVDAWIERAAKSFGDAKDRDIAVKRIDMIMAHDALSHLGKIHKPTLVICGDHNLCTPLPLSEELAHSILGAEPTVLEDAGELIEFEKDEEYFETISAVIRRNL